jgi:hypothetical protein
VFAIKVMAEHIVTTVQTLLSPIQTAPKVSALLFTTLRKLMPSLQEDNIMSMDTPQLESNISRKEL